MDYSSIAQDPEHPAGASPWSSSPQHNRTTFNNAGTGDMPPSPLPPAAQLPFVGSTEQEHSGLRPEQGASAGRYGTVENGHEEQAAAAQAQARAPHTAQPEQHSYGQGHERHGEAGSQQRQPRQKMPQYKLQAKITGLERSGRKDPILRFDVYVRIGESLSLS